jgi:prepilin-type N-terminal cleavage/methylation domain-containing protein
MIAETQRGRLRRGFTLLELLSVVIVIGILASIAIAKYRGVKERAFMGTIRSDLKTLAANAEFYFVDRGTYEGFAPTGLSRGVVVDFVGTATGYEVTARHDGAPGLTCTMRQSGDVSDSVICTGL